MLPSAIRGFAAGFGIAAGPGLAGRVSALRERLRSAEDDELPAAARETVATLIEQLDDPAGRMEAIERSILAWYRASEVSRRPATVPGIGRLNATPIAATVPDAPRLGSGREFAARIGPVPRERSRGGRQRPGGIAERGNPISGGS